MNSDPSFKSFARKLMMHAPVNTLRRWLWPTAGLVAIAVFAGLAGRFWHPYYGFTKFVQLDEADARSGIPEIRRHPVFTYAGFNGYDGAAYTQIAFHPLLDSPDLQPALGNVPYRARRILGSALAWLLAGGDPARIASTYAALNLGVWLALAALLWRVLPVTDARSFVAWSGVLFSAGALHSVRLALTDLLAATLATAALGLAERGRTGGALGVLASAGLARETALAAVVGLWRGPWTTPRPWIANVVRTGLVAAPLFAWILYVRWKAGPAAQGFGNFTWPVVGWLEKFGAAISDFAALADFRWLTTTTLLATLALTVQAIFFLRERRWSDAWWRVGASGVAMMALLGTPVWEGHPGAATRVLLPMAVAFAVVAVRTQARWRWIIGGSLTVFSGVLALWHVPHEPRELAAGRFSGGSYLAKLGDGWYGAERDSKRTWSWAATRATVVIASTARPADTSVVRLKLRAFTARRIEVRWRETLLWEGTVGEKLESIPVKVTWPAGEPLALEISSTIPGAAENTHPDARTLGFALYGVALD